LVCNQQLAPTQPSTLSGTEMSKSLSAVTHCSWGVKTGRPYGSFHLWINVRVTGKTVIPRHATHAIPERFRDEFLKINAQHKSTVTLLYIVRSTK